MLEVVNKIIEMSVQASFVICIILIVRFIFLKINIPKRLIYFLWVIPLFRLVCPVTIATNFSLIPTDLSFESENWDNRVIQTAPVTDMTAPSEGNQPSADTAGAGILGMGAGETTGDIAGTTGNVGTIFESLEHVTLTATDIFTIVWFIGIGLLAVYSIVSTVGLRKKLVGSIWVTNNYYRADHIDTPFVLGVFRPKIFLPSSISEADLDMIIMHEQMHIRRKDYIAKIIVFAVTCVYWFNPCAWIMYVLFCKDMENSIDEKVIAHFDLEQRKEYATLLLALSTGKRNILSAPLAFGEGNVKGRIKNVVKYKKPLTAIFVIAIIAVIILAAGLLTSTKHLLSENSEIEYLEVRYKGYEIYLTEDEQEQIVEALKSCKMRMKVAEAGVYYYNEEEHYSVFISTDKEGSLIIELDSENAYAFDNIGYILTPKTDLYTLLEGLRSEDNWKEKHVYEESDAGISMFAQDFINEFTDSVYREESISYATLENYTYLNKLIEYTQLMQKYTMHQKIIGVVFFYGPNNVFADVKVKHLGNHRYLVTAPFESGGFHATAQVLVRYSEGEPWIENYCLGIENSVDMIAAGTAEEREISNPEKWKDAEWTQQVMDNLKAYGAEMTELTMESGENYYTEGLSDYYQNEDGTWQAEGYTYKYRLILKGQLNNAAVGSIYIVLSNDPNITFEDAMWASGLSSHLEDYFSPTEANLVEWRSYHLPDEDGLPIYEYTGDDPIMKAICEYQVAIDLPSDSEYGTIRIPTPVIVHIDDADSEDIKVWGNFWSFNFKQDGTMLVKDGGGEYPGVIHLAKTDNGYIVTNFERLGNGVSYDEDSIKALCKGYPGLQKKFSNSLGGVTDEQFEILDTHVRQYVDDNQLNITSYEGKWNEPVDLN